MRALSGFLILLMYGPLIADNPPVNPRLVWLRDPTSTVTVSWNTPALGKSHHVHVRERGAGEDAHLLTFPSMRDRKFSYIKEKDGHLPLFFHHAQVDGLKPGTTYDLQIVSDGSTSPVYYFATAPGGTVPFTLLFGGDSRSSRETRQEMNEMMAQLVKRSWESSDPADRIAALMHGGDFVESGTNFKQWKGWMDDHDRTIGQDGRLLPIIPARGNHDRGRLFCHAFGFDAKDNHNWYVQSFGELLALVTLNTESSIAGKQASWLSKQLKRNRPNHRWLIAQYHRPAYAAVKWPSGALLHWVPRFEKFNVDLVCEADGHNIKRTMPIRRNRPHPNGIVYIGEGGLGVPQRTPKNSRWYIQSPGMADFGSHVQRLKFEPHQLTYECILLGGEIRDTSTLTPRKLKAPVVGS